MATIDVIQKLFKRDLTDSGCLEDIFQGIRLLEQENFNEAHKLNKQLRNIAASEAQKNMNADMLEIYHKTLYFDAPYEFESYLLALEYNRKPEEKFYQPRRKILKRIVDALQRLADNELDELFVSEPPRVGKALADSTPILTTLGWKKHGELCVGDVLFSPDGGTTKVIAVHPKCEMTHKVTMTDGSEFICHFRHEWQVYNRRSHRVEALETQEMIGKTENGAKYGNKRGHRYNFQLLQKEPLEGVEVNLPVPPYTLGAWLGDGTNKQPRITWDKKDYDVIQGIIADGYEVNHQYVHKTTGAITTDFEVALRKDLNSLGMCYHNKRVEKHIPQQYLVAPKEQRLKLLAGLLDTDGTLIKDEHRYQYSTTSEELKNSFISLVSTFGWRVNVRKTEPHTSSFGIVGKLPCWVVSFNPTEHIPCRLERKQLFEFSKPRRIAIKSIEELPEEQRVTGNCITVEKDGMYLAGDKLTPTHNTSILMFYVTWLIGRDSERSNLYVAFSDIITSAFYNGVLEILNDPITYDWHSIFPKSKIVSTNAKDETLNIDRKKRYPSLTCRSLYGTLNGACDCNGILIADDLIGGIEEALNKDRLVAAWAKVDNNMIPRAKENAKILFCGTRWSLSDPAGIRMDLLANDPSYKTRRFEIINLPALDENDESNFEYNYGVGFSTEYYRQRRASFERNNDMASWQAQYMGEPIERSGALFEPGDMKFYNGVLPDETPVRIFMACDPAWGGGDFVSAPIFYQYENGDVYVHDVVYNDGDKRITQPLIEKKIIAHHVQAAYFEANKMTASYKEAIEENLIKQGYRLNITAKAAPTDVAKEQRIFDCAPEIRELYFIEDGKRSKEYSLFMQNVFSFKMSGKNKHDDAPDSLAMGISMIRRRSINKVEVFRRPF